jgi:hypothetical protein
MFGSPVVTVLALPAGSVACGFGGNGCFYLSPLIGGGGDGVYRNLELAPGLVISDVGAAAGVGAGGGRQKGGGEGEGNGASGGHGWDVACVFSIGKGGRVR